MRDPIAQLAELGATRLVTDYLDLTVQLERGTGTRPVLWLLKDARDKAIDAMCKLIDVDASEKQAIRALQAEVRLYCDMVESCQKLMVRGKEADGLIDEEERREIADMLTPDEAREMGLQPSPED